MELLLHGVYDAQTLKTILSKNCSRIGFDLRARSSSLVPFHVLKELIPYLAGEKFHVLFENDNEATVLAFLDLLKEHRQQVILEFRDSKPAEYYQKIDASFMWAVNPYADWKNILLLPKIIGVVLPLRHKTIFQTLPELWDIIERRSLDVYLHVDTLSELDGFDADSNLKLSADLSREIESSYRHVDQQRLRGLGIWRGSDENIAGQ